MTTVVFDIRTFLVSICLLIITPMSFAQCPNNNSLNNANATPACPGSITVNCVSGGQYVLVNVVAGNTYTFSTCGGANWDTQITLYNNTGGGSLGYNDDACGLQSTVTWVATFTGQLRVLMDRFNCANQNSCAALNIQCSAPPSGGDCVYSLTMNDSWGDGWGSSYVSVSINGGAWQNYTVTGTTNTVYFALDIGNTISISYNASGAWQGENSYSLSILGGGGALYSSGSPPSAGMVFSQTVDCVPPPAPPQDCVGGTTICGNQSFNNNSNNTGNVVDLNGSNQGCLSSGERQGTWYYFSPSAGGTIGFTISPSAAIDYDFAVWGPMSTITCPPSGPPLRCSYASHTSTFSQTGSYNTGLGNGANDVSESPAGNGWVAPLNVVTGQIYILFVDNFSSTGQSFSLSWQLGGGASLDCTILPVELIAFEAHARNDDVVLNWSTGSEQNSDHFLMERSIDGIHFQTIGSVTAAGSSASLVDYSFKDGAPFRGINFYRLKQIDLDGSQHDSGIRAVDFKGGQVIIHPNPTNGPITIDLTSISDENMGYRIHDMYGRIVRTGTFTTVGNGRVQLDISDLHTGNYLLEIQHGDGSRAVVRAITLN